RGRRGGSMVTRTPASRAALARAERSARQAPAKSARFFLTAVLAFGATCRGSAPAATPNPELLQLYEQDQADRRGAPQDLEWSKVAARADSRRRRTGEILASGGARVAEDFYRAAMIFQHCPDSSDVEKARALALRAVELRPDYREARWLAAAALDRQ